MTGLFRKRFHNSPKSSAKQASLCAKLLTLQGYYVVLKEPHPNELPSALADGWQLEKISALAKQKGRFLTASAQIRLKRKGNLFYGDSAKAYC